MKKAKKENENNNHNNKLQTNEDNIKLGDLDDFIFYGEPIKYCSER